MSDICTYVLTSCCLVGFAYTFREAKKLLLLLKFRLLPIGGAIGLRPFARLAWGCPQKPDGFIDYIVGLLTAK